MYVTPLENSKCTAFEEYEEVPEMVPLDFSEDDVTWVTSKLSGADGALVPEAIKLRNYLLSFGCASEVFRAVVANLDYWIATPPPPVCLPCSDGMLPRCNGLAPRGVT